MRTATKSDRQPHPISPMLEGGYSTSIENTVACLNNELARKGWLTSEPAAVLLRQVRRELKEMGCSFEVTIAQEIIHTAPVAKVVAKATPAPVATKAAPAAVHHAPTGKVREIAPEELATLAVAGTESDGAPYGRDAKGRALAPYGVKLDGVTPKLRRGRKAAVEAEDGGAEILLLDAAPATPKPTAKAAIAKAVIQAEADDDGMIDLSDDSDEEEAPVAECAAEDEDDSAEEEEEIAAAPTPAPVAVTVVRKAVVKPPVTEVEDDGDLDALLSSL